MEVKAGTIKVFAMNDCDWMAGETVEDCLREYKANYSGDYDGDDPLEPEELDDEEMNTLRFTNDEIDKKWSFREQLNWMIERGEKFPTFFASTEY